MLQIKKKVYDFPDKKVQTKNEVITVKYLRDVMTLFPVGGGIIIVYGGSGDGKSFIIRDLVYLANDQFIQGFAFCATEGASPEASAYSDFIPVPMIHTGIKKGSSKFNAIFEDAKAFTKKINMGRTFELLRNAIGAIKGQVNPARFKKFTNTIGLIKNNEKEDIAGLSLDERAYESGVIKKRCKSECIAVYRDFIKDIHSSLDMTNVSSENKIILLSATYRKYATLMIADDIKEYADASKGNAKRCGENVLQLNKMATDGRQWSIYTFVAAQTYSMASTTLRASPQAIIFLNKEIFGQYITERGMTHLRPLGNFLETKDRFALIKTAKNGWFYYKAMGRAPFKVGSKLLNAVMDKIKVVNQAAAAMSREDLELAE